MYEWGIDVLYVVAGLMCEPGRFWLDTYSSWMNHAAVILLLLSEDYLGSEPCRGEFEDAVTKQVPNPENRQRIVIPLVVTSSSIHRHLIDSAAGHLHIVHTLCGKVLKQAHTLHKLYRHIPHTLKQSVTHALTLSLSLALSRHSYYDTDADADSDSDSWGTLIHHRAEVFGLRFPR